MLDGHLSSTMNQAVGKLSLSFAQSPSEIAEAQRLRYSVFAEEMGANIEAHDGLDHDRFDPYCEHLLIREVATNRVVGTYRILCPKSAKQAGGYYSASEFDLGRLEPILDHTVEVGRACVHADFRNGGTIAMLWGGLARYMVEHDHEFMIGCGSVSMADGGHMAASLYNQLRKSHLAPPEYQVTPLAPLPLQTLNADLDVACPPLIKGYLRVGAYICGEPSWDPHFNSADMLVLLPMSRMNKRYASHFFK